MVFLSPLIIVLIPKNSGLKEQALKVLKDGNISGEIIELRGEDIPLFASSLIKDNKRVIGITGEDLFKEFLLKNKNTGIKVLKKVSWYDETYIFKKPALCLLGKKDKKIDDLPSRLRICINSKYKRLAKKCCINFLEDKGYKFKTVYASGGTEEFFTKGIVDLVIDIVCSGDSAEKAGLEIYDKLFESDIVVIGGENVDSIN